MGRIQVPYTICDFRGCGVRWPAGAKNGNLEVIFGVHQEIHMKLCHSVPGKYTPATLIKEVFDFCPDHAWEIKDPLANAVKLLGGVEGPDLKPDLGCWITMWHWHGGLIQQVLNHQFNHNILTLLYRGFHNLPVYPKKVNKKD